MDPSSLPHLIVRADVRDDRDASEISPTVLSSTLNAFCATHQGRRQYQEDRVVARAVPCTAFPEAALYAVLDGHGGATASEFCATELPKIVAEFMTEAHESITARDVGEALRSAFIDTERALLQHMHSLAHMPADSGTCVVALIVLPQHLVLASAGDCRSLLVKRDGSYSIASVEHRADLSSELSRVQAAGFDVYEGRVSGMLSVTRSIGDFEFKRNQRWPFWKSEGLEAADAVTCIPDIAVIARSAEDTAACLMSDGVYDCTAESLLADLCVSQPLPMVPSLAIRAALNAESFDNLSVVIVPLG